MTDKRKRMTVLLLTAPVIGAAQVGLFALLYHTLRNRIDSIDDPFNNVLALFIYPFVLLAFHLFRLRDRIAFTSTATGLMLFPFTLASLGSGEGMVLWCVGVIALALPYIAEIVLLKWKG